MKKKILFIILITINFLAVRSQGGVSISSNLKANSAFEAGNVTVTKSGQTGIGVDNPINNILHVNGTLRIKDGTEGEGKVFADKGNGIGCWKNIPYAFIKKGGVLDKLNSIYNGGWDEGEPENYFKYVGAQITLEKGQWQIYFTCNYRSQVGTDFIIWWDLCTDTKWSLPNQKGRALSYFCPNAVSGITTIAPTYASYYINVTESQQTFYVLGMVARTLPSQKVGTLTFDYVDGARMWALKIK